MSDPADTKVNWLWFMESPQSIAQTGISYTKDTYDKERYTMILELIADRYSELSGKTKEAICESLFNEVGDATPKICVRGLILKGNKVLLVKEREKALWSLSGGGLK